MLKAILHQGKSSASLWSECDDSKSFSTGVILENTNDNADGKAGEVLYIAFRETTGTRQFMHWANGIFKTEPVATYFKGLALTQDAKESVKDVRVNAGIWCGPYTSNTENVLTGNDSIRKQLLA